MPKGVRRHHRSVAISGFVNGLLISSAPSSSGVLDLGPTRVGPSFEGGEWLVEGSFKPGEPVEGWSVNAASVEETCDQAIALSTPQRLGEHLVGDSISRVVKIVETTPIDRKLAEDRESPPATDETHECTGMGPMITQGIANGSSVDSCITSDDRMDADDHEDRGQQQED